MVSQPLWQQARDTNLTLYVLQAYKQFAQAGTWAAIIIALVIETLESGNS